MNILIFFGSARKKGHTREILDLLLDKAPHDAKITIIDAYRREDIAPCKDCRYCWRTPGCCIQDGAQEIYESVERADVLIFATPVYFHSVTGPLKVLIDRFQTYWASSLRGDRPSRPRGKGAFLLTGGARPFTDQFLGAELVLKGVLNDLGFSFVGSVCAADTDHLQIKEDQRIRDQLKQVQEVLF